MKKLDYIDALRAFAILAVIMVHTSQYGVFDVPNIFKGLIDQGARGVQLFYVCSAFTLFLSGSHRKTTESSPTRNFFIRRVFRIAPMYYLGILYYLWQDGTGPRYWLGDASHISIKNILANFTFLHGVNPYWINSLVPGGWSITVEMMFYAMVPFLFTRIKNLSHAIYFLGITLIIRYLLNSFFLHSPLIGHNRLWADFLSLYLPNQMPIFALGIILYFILMDGAKASGLSLMVLSVLVLANLTLGKALVLVEHIEFGVAFVILALALSRYSPVLLVNPITKFIGKLSFSMYLVHFAVLHWMNSFGFIDFATYGPINYALRFLIVVAVSSAISYFFYNQVEMRFQKYGKKLIDSLENKNAISKS